MPPRYAYWTILIDGQATAFRAREREELLPTFNQLARKNADIAMKYFARGRLWDTPEQAQWANRNMPGAGAPREKRSRDWRPGGQHQDPRARFKGKGAKSTAATNLPPEPSARPLTPYVQPKDRGGKPEGPYKQPTERGRKRELPFLEVKDSRVKPSSPYVQPKDRGAKPTSSYVQPRDRGTKPGSSYVQPKDRSAKPSTPYIQPKDRGKPETGYVQPKDRRASGTETRAAKPRGRWSPPPKRKPR